MSIETIFVGMIFVLVLLMSQSFVTPIMGSRRQARKRLRKRLMEIKTMEAGSVHGKLMRDRYLEQLSPLERKLETMPAMERLRTSMKQAGMDEPGYRLVLRSLLYGAVAATIAAFQIGDPIVAVLAGLAAGSLPFVFIRRRRAKRLALFEEQLPDALTVAARSMRAGLPFSESLNMVSTEMDDPVGAEFGQLFNELNYGGDVRSAFLSLLARMPTIAVMAVVSAVLIQRETGGNLAEVLDNISSIIRQRFRFQRSVRTLTAEGRGTAWVVVVMPFLLAATAEFLKPGWVIDMVQDPQGQRLYMMAFGLMVIGILWLRQMVRIDV